MTSVPKPLKFLMKHYDSLKYFHDTLPTSDNKSRLADVISILAISSGPKGERESLEYRLEGSEVSWRTVAPTPLRGTVQQPSKFRLRDG